MNKLRTEIVLFIDLFLVFLLGGTLLFYSLFAEKYYLSQKKSQINQVYTYIQTLNLNDLGNEDEETFLPLDNASAIISICDSDFQPLYASKSKNGNSILTDQIRKQADTYTESASAVYFPHETGRPIALHGLIHQEGNAFYILIYENTRMLHSGLRYTRQILGNLLFLAISLGTLFALLFSEWLTRPLSRIRQLIQRMMKNDFSQRLPEQSRFNELGELSTEINLMGDKI